MPFELDHQAATLKTVTPRKDIHGDSHVTAVSFGLKFEAPNTLLDHISPALRHALYTRPEAQGELEGVEPSTPLLRCSLFDIVSLKGALEGWTVKVDHGIDEGEPMTFGGCKIDAFKVSPMQGGSIELHLRIGTSDIDGEEIGLLCDKLQEEIVVTITPPVPKADAIDGSAEGGGPGFEPKPEAGDLFAAEHGDDPEDDEPAREPSDVDPALSAEAKREANRSAEVDGGTRTARGKARTKAALAKDATTQEFIGRNAPAEH